MDPGSGVRLSDNAEHFGGARLARVRGRRMSAPAVALARPFAMGDGEWVGV